MGLPIMEDRTEETEKKRVVVLGGRQGGREREPKGRKRKVRKAPTMLAKNKCPKNILHLKILTVQKVVDFLNFFYTIFVFWRKL